MNKSAIAEEALRMYPEARRIAVENFLWTLLGTNQRAEEMNLLKDARAYGWDIDTIEAIAFGIDIYYNRLN